MISSPTIAQLSGQSTSHLAKQSVDNCQIHARVLPAYLRLQEEATRAGFKLTAVSGFRSFERQLMIWNNKFTGLRPILDQHSQPLDSTIMNDEEKVFAILRWSMLPGASRHHWGSDIDICDTLSLPNDYQLQLIPQEYEQGGYLFEFNQWLDENMPYYGFFKPYREDLGGVSREPWHISFRKVAQDNMNHLQLDLLIQIIQQSEIQGKSSILANIEQIYQQYIINISID